MRREKNHFLFICCLFLLLSNFALFSVEPFFRERRERVFSAIDFVEPSAEYEIVSDVASKSYVKQPGKVSVKLRLKNGMDVLLISDPLVSQSAVALSIGSGSWNNPADMPGLAHFVEHLVFMGSAKYPEESDFSRFIGERGGEYNAFTSHDRTVYGFSINHEGLEGAADRLSRFFIDPLFSPSAIEREKNAVHHEFEDHAESDTLKIWRVIKETGNQSHPNAIFSCGNLDSLSTVTQKEVKLWHKRYYTPSRMHLVVVSAMSLKDLAALSVKCFGAIPSSDSFVDDLSGDLLTSQQKGQLIFVEPSFQNRSLQLLWEVPKKFFQNEICSAVELLELALDHDEEGSLTQLLAEKDLAGSVTIDNWRIEKNHLLFLIEISLTKNGVAQYQEVVHNVFSALNKIKQEGIPSYLYDHLYKTKLATSEYVTPSDSFSYAIDTAITLVDEDLSVFPSAQLASSSYSENYAEDFLEFLSPHQCVFFLMAPSREFPIKLSKLEKWMKTPYVVRSLSKELLTAWHGATANPMFSVRPQIGEDDEADLCNPLEDMKSLDSLESVIDTKGLTVRLAKGAEEEAEAQLGAFFSIKSPLFTRSVHDAAKASLYLRCFQDYAEQYFSDKGGSWSVLPGETDVCLVLELENNLNSEHVVNFFRALRSYRASEEVFQEMQSFFLDYFPGDPDPLDYAQALFEVALNPNTFTYVELFKEIQNVSYEEYCTFHDELFSHIHFDGIFYGSMSLGEVTSLWSKVDQVLFQESVFEEEGNLPPPEKEDVFAWSGKHIVRQQTHRKGHALLLALNLGTGSREAWVVQKILAQLLQEEFFDELRTKQQTAYRVYSWPDNHGGQLMHILGLQSSTHSADELLSRTEHFLAYFAENFKSKVTKERVQLVRHMLISALKRQRQSLSDTAEDTSWISSAIEVLRTVSYERVCSAAEIYFSPENKKRIAVLVDGR